MSLDAGPSLYDAAMGTDSKPEAWQTSAHGAWSTLDKGVAIETVPGQRGMHRITWPGGERQIEGNSAAQAFAHEMVAKLARAKLQAGKD